MNQQEQLLKELRTEFKRHCSCAVVGVVSYQSLGDRSFVPLCIVSLIEKCGTTGVRDRYAFYPGMLNVIVSSMWPSDRQGLKFNYILLNLPTLP